MVATSQPFGLQVARAIGGAPHAIGQNAYPIASLTTATLFAGMPVALNANGVVDVCTSAGYSAGPTLGVFAGCQYTDPSTKQRLQRSYWPGGTSATDAIAFVVDNPWQTFFIQANTSVGATAVGQVGGFTTASYTSGSGITGTSYGMLNVSSLGTSAGMLRIIGLQAMPGNAWDDAYTVVEVQIANHQFNTTAGI